VFSLALFYLKASRIFDGTCTFAYPWKYLWKKLANNFKPIKRGYFINYLQGSIKFLYLPLRSITYRVSTKSTKYYRLFSVLSSTWAIFLIFYLKTFCILLVNYSHMKEMLAYQFLCHTHMYYFSIYIRVGEWVSVCVWEFCVLGNICHKLPEVLYRLSLLPHIFATKPFFKWRTTNALALLKFLAFFAALPSRLFCFYLCCCLCGPDNNPLCVASILHQSISKW